MSTINKSQYKITSSKNRYSSNNKYFGMSTIQIIWACFIALGLGIFTGWIIVMMKG